MWGEQWINLSSSPHAIGRQASSVERSNAHQGLGVPHTECVSAGRPKIVVQAVGRLANDVVPWRNVAAIDKHISFVFFRRAQQPEHGLLGSHDGKDEIVPAIDQQCGNFHVGSKVDLPEFRELPYRAEAAANKYGSTKAVLQRQHHWSLARSLADTIIGKLLVIEVSPSLYVIH